MSGARWIVIPRWDGDDGFQHYKDREPIWIKNYRRLLHDEDYLGLTLHQRGVLHGLWLEYAAASRQIPDSTSAISRRLGDRVTRATLDALNHAGFIEFSASKPLASRYQVASPEKEKSFPKGFQEPASKTALPKKADTQKRDLRRYTGCRRTQGTHGESYKPDPLGTEKPPTWWTHPKPTEEEIVMALEARG